MDQQPLPPAGKPSPGLAVVALILSIAALAVATFGLFRPAETAPAATRDNPTTLDRVISERTLRVGVGAFPPYTFIDPSKTEPKERYTGLTIDMVRHMAEKFDPPWSIEFHEV